MRIGIDISVLQSAHRMRGIGSTTINFLNNLSDEAKKNDQFIFFVLPKDYSEIDALDHLELSGVTYELRDLRPPKNLAIKLPGIIGKVINIGLRNWQILLRLWFGDRRITKLKDVDYFLQFDQHQCLPARRKVRSAILVYDIIPYILESDYLWSYATSRLRGCSRKGALRNALRRRRYRTNTKSILRKSYKIIAISEHTKRDLVKYISINPKRICVCLLGVNLNPEVKTVKQPSLKRYVASSWGYIPKKISLDKDEFLLFVGGADPRRKLVELVAAFNNLRARGHNLKLVLVGDTMYGAFDVPNIELQHYLKNTSYVDDIYFLGFVTNDQRDWLFSRALVFIYPSVYEGFGLPVLEAMQYGTPVITYNNSSIKEVADNAVLYGHDYLSIIEQVIELSSNAELRKKYVQLGLKQSAKFNWSATAKAILGILKS